MADFLLQAVEQWFQKLPPLPPQLPVDIANNDSKAIQALLCKAYDCQTCIGWLHFLHGHLTKAWKPVLAKYYQMIGVRCNLTPELWMQKMIEALWHMYIEIWYCCNGQVHGKDFKEVRQRALEMHWTTAQDVYQQMHGNVSQNKARLLHSRPVEEILNWMKAHLDAYLATAEVILEQNVDPG
jgi:hypothetical protein